MSKTRKRKLRYNRQRAMERIHYYVQKRKIADAILNGNVYYDKTAARHKIIIDGISYDCRLNDV